MEQVLRYEVVDKNGEFITSYSADLAKNTGGKVCGLKCAKSTAAQAGHKVYAVLKDGTKQLV